MWVKHWTLMVHSFYYLMVIAASSVRDTSASAANQSRLSAHPYYSGGLLAGDKYEWQTHALLKDKWTVNVQEGCVAPSPPVCQFVPNSWFLPLFSCDMVTLWPWGHFLTRCVKMSVEHLVVQCSRTLPHGLWGAGIQTGKRPMTGQLTHPLCHSHPDVYLYLNWLGSIGQHHGMTVVVSWCDTIHYLTRLRGNIKSPWK